MPIDAAVLNALLDNWRPYAASGPGPVTIGYEFMTELPADSAPVTTGFDAASTDQRAALRSVFDAIERVANIRFVESGTEPSAGPTLRIGQASDLGGTNWRSGDASSGFVNDVYLPPQAAESLAPGGQGFFDMMALVAQSLGLKRPDDSIGGTLPTIGGVNDSQLYTVMSNNLAPDHDLGGGVQAYARSPLVNDVAALQSIYGANTATGAGDGDVYDVSNVPADGVFTIWDAGGAHDRIDASGASGNVILDLNEGALSSVNGSSNVSIAYGGAGNENPIEDATGGAGSDTLIGSAKGNVLDGGASADTMMGGDGNDTYYVDNRYDYVSESEGGGTDTVIATLSGGFTQVNLADQVETLEVRIAPDAYGDFVAMGSAQDNRVDAADEAQVRLYGGDGNDTINGGSLIDGGAGADMMAGGRGSDIYYVDDAGDVVIEVNDGGLVDAGGGYFYEAQQSFDTVYSNVSFALGDNLEALQLTGDADIDGTGNALANNIIGNAGNNVLRAVGMGQSSSAGDFLDGRGGDDQLIGGDGPTAMYGGGGNDQLAGGASNDVLEGGEGVDLMTGGGGDDAYYVDNAADVIVEGTGGGIDEVNSSVSFALADNLETLYLRGFDEIDGTGNEADNAIYGNDAANVIDGGDGNDMLDGVSGIDHLIGGAGNDVLYGNGQDTLEGGAGNDEYYVRGTDDVIVEGVNGGTDSVLAFTSHVLAANVENLTLAEGYFIDGTGNDGDNVINGNSLGNVLRGLGGNDSLNGGNGRDVLAGGVGDDLMIGGGGNDGYEFGRGDGQDVAEDSSGFDELHLTGGLTVNDIGVQRAGSDLVVGINGTADSITLRNWFVTGQTIDTFRFDGGMVLDTVAIEALISDNRAPVASDDAASISEDAVAPMSGNVLANDGDPDPGTTLTLADAGSLAGNYGTIVFSADGGFSYTLDGSLDPVRSLGSTQVLTETFGYTVRDDAVSAKEDSAMLTVTIQGANDAPVAVDDVAAVSEDGTTTVSGNVLGNDLEIDVGQLLEVAGAGVYAGLFGSLSLDASGAYTYTLNNASAGVQSLVGGQQVEESFSYTVRDNDAGGSLQDQGVLRVTIRGSNDAPVAVDDVAAVSEDGTTTVSGNVLANDLEIDAGQLLSMAGPGVFAGLYGSLTLAANGAYTYTLDNASAAVQSLRSGQQVEEAFTYIVRDNDASGALEDQGVLRVSIAGRNDAPVVNRAMADAVATMGTAFSMQFAADTFADIDGESLALSASLGNGAALPSWLRFDAATRTFSGTPAAYGVTSVRVTATDAMGANVVDEFNLTVDQSVQAGRDIYGTRRNDTLNGTSGNDRLFGRDGYDTLNGGAGNDRLDGGSGNDRMVGGVGDDTYVVGSSGDVVVEQVNEGNDTVESSVSWQLGENVENLRLTGSNRINGAGNALDNLIAGNWRSNVLSGGAGNDYLQGRGGDDTLKGDAGIDILDGGSGNDQLRDTDGASILLGGSGRDSITGGAAASFYAGGRGDDTLTLGSGQDVVAFNRGDGHDTVMAGGGNGTLSLGAGVRYEDLKFRRDGASLVLATGAGESITLKDWYSSAGNQGISTLQVVAETMPGYAAGGSNPLLDDRIETFDFRQLVQAYDEATTGTSNVRRWALMNELLDAHVSDSDTEALGGDLAYRYGLDGALTGMSADAARSVVAAGGFGANPQALRPLAQLQDGMPKLA